MNDKRRHLVAVGFFFLAASFIKAEIYYPWKDVYIGALDNAAWCGLVFAPQKNHVFAFRLKIAKGNGTADGMDMLFLVSEVGPHSPDGQYALLKFDLSLPFNMRAKTPVMIKPASGSDTLVFEWSRQDERTVIGRIKAPKYVDCRMVHYFPWEIEGKYLLLEDGQVYGRGPGDSGYHYLLWTDRKGTVFSSQSENELSLNFPMKKEREIYFAAGIHEDRKILENHLYRYKNRRSIASLIEEKKQRYIKARVHIDNLYEGVAEAITNNLFWMSLYQPDKHRMYTPAGRRWIFPRPGGGDDHWTIFEWDSFFNALEVAVESTKHAKDIVRSVLETQYPNGNIPNWRGRFSGSADRSQPPVGAFVVLKLFQRMGDIDFLKEAYPFLKKWHAFWRAGKSGRRVRRDGNGDGLLEWGSDAELIPSFVPSWEDEASGKQRSMWESGMDDLPNWDDTLFFEKSGTLNMNCLDLNCLYALDAWCLAEICAVIGLKDESRTHKAEYEHMKSLINQHLWDETEGFYFDRYWNGRFSTRKAASNFYPLVARIPDEKRAFRMIKRLLDDKEYWGEYVLPTISRDDPGFKDQQYWRGTIWPPTNYLVYQGLKAYHFDAVASEFANKSYSLFMRSWENFQLCPENFDSRTGEAGGQRYQSWGPLFALIALEEYIDFTPWEGFRFGMINPDDKGKIRRLSIHGRHYDMEVSRKNIKLKEEGKEIVRANGGAVFRHFLYSENEISFEIKTFEEREIKIRFLFEGKYQLLIDGQSVDIFKGKSVDIRIPDGEHSVMILLLEKKK
ncbi:MAG: hypothetical protein JXB26_15165 [Candidatus Aminicenantes bacterium]|nr:hypothetical protein [Candidatus Aminicenantes bacterium]